MKRLIQLLVFSAIVVATLLSPMRGFSMQDTGSRLVSGVVATRKDEVLQRITVIAKGDGFEKRTETGDAGEFRMDVPAGPVLVRVEGQYIRPEEQAIPGDAISTNLHLFVDYRIPPIHQSIVIVASAMQANTETYNAEVYRRAPFGRDDQLLDTLAAGINAGQHEGGGKSLEIRRFGFNTDHGGVNGGLKILVDNVQQNQGTQGHGQGYLGALKSLTPELVEDVQIVNGPFSPEYGDFSGLGVAHIRLKESLANPGTFRVQGGSFGSYRTFLAYSPRFAAADSFISYEGSRTDGPFDSPLRYRRDNVTGNYVRHLDASQDLGGKINFGRNDFLSSGQLPLDLVATGQLSRYAAVDPTNGGRVRLGTGAMYYRKTLSSGANLKLDGFVGRSLFDLYSNFTMFLNDTERGDGIQQHDSRYQQGFNSQYLKPWRAFGSAALFTVGTNFHANEINVGLYPQERRVPFGVTTNAFARVTNTAGYAQQGFDLLKGRLHVEGGLRWDYFRFRVNDQIDPILSGAESAATLQPKFGMAYSPTSTLPLTLTFNYGRGINTQDARGVVRNPDGPKVATTDFFQFGASVQKGPVSLVSDLFLIARSNEQVYIPDDGSFELSDPSRSSGFEHKISITVNRHISLHAGVTQIMNAYYRDTNPRLYVDSAPRTVANAALTLSGWQNLYASLRWRHVSNYRLDGVDPGLRASGLDVMDLAITKALRTWLDFNIDIDNVTDKSY